ncbi:MAG: extracellular matrix regulator RemB [Eubacteriales bacterium]
MFLHLGGDVVVPKKDIIVILDVQARQSQVTREFFEISGEEGFIKKISGPDKEKSFVITTREIFVSPISCNTLKKRSKSFLEI